MSYSIQTHMSAIERGREKALLNIFYIQDSGCPFDFQLHKITLLGTSIRISPIYHFSLSVNHFVNLLYRNKQYINIHNNKTPGNSFIDLPSPSINRLTLERIPHSLDLPSSHGTPGVAIITYNHWDSACEKYHQHLGDLKKPNFLSSTKIFLLMHFIFPRPIRQREERRASCTCSSDSLCSVECKLTSPYFLERFYLTAG